MKLTKKEQREVLLLLWDWKDSGSAIKCPSLTKLIKKLEKSTGMDYGTEVERRNCEFF